MRAEGVAWDAFTVCTLWAERTTRLQVATGFVSAVTRQPGALARAAITVQELSRGRFRLGLGVGNNPEVPQPASPLREMARGGGRGARLLARPAGARCHPARAGDLVRRAAPEDGRSRDQGRRRRHPQLGDGRPCARNPPAGRPRFSDRPVSCGPAPARAPRPLRRCATTCLSIVRCRSIGNRSSCRASIRIACPTTTRCAW
ncbi:MAG: LLM class flavin-dependent oxidoreductase [Pseudomonadota bacterium]